MFVVVVAVLLLMGGTAWLVQNPDVFANLPRRRLIEVALGACLTSITVGVVAGVVAG